MKAIVLSLALAVLAGGAQAQITGAQVLATFQQKGFTQIEVKSLGSTIKVEAVKGGMNVEVIYDTATGKIVKQESRRAEDAPNGSGDGAGRDVGDDNGSGGNGSDDRAGHDAGDDRGGSGSSADQSGSDQRRSGRGGSGRRDRSDD